MHVNWQGWHQSLKVKCTILRGKIPPMVTPPSDPLWDTNQVAPTWTGATGEGCEKAAYGS